MNFRIWDKWDANGITLKIVKLGVACSANFFLEWPMFGMVVTNTLLF